MPPAGNDVWKGPGDARATNEQKDVGEGKEQENRHKQQLLGGSVEASELESNPVDKGITYEQADQQNRVEVALVREQDRRAESDGDEQRREHAFHGSFPRMHLARPSSTRLPN